MQTHTSTKTVYHGGHHHHTFVDGTHAIGQHSHPMKRHGGFGYGHAHGQHKDALHEHGGLEGWDCIGKRYTPDASRNRNVSS